MPPNCTTGGDVVADVLIGSGPNRWIVVIITMAMMHIYKGIIPFVLLQLLAIVILSIFPAVTTWLPELFFGG